MWSEEAILEANGEQDPATTTKLMRIKNQAGPCLDYLAHIADEIESRSTNHVAAFFQLPYPVRVEAGWYRLPTIEANVFADVRFDLFELTYANDGGISLVRAVPDGPHQGPLITQVCALFPVWGARSNYYEKYQDLLYREGSWKQVVIPLSSSWIGFRSEFGNRPATVSMFETNFAGKLLQMANALLRDFLPSYSVISLSETPIPEKILGFCSMLSPGRIVFAGDYVPVYRAMLNAIIERQNSTVCSRANVESALRVRYRRLSQFELQILAMERIRRRGEPALALIGTYSLLEWLIETHFDKRGIAIKNLKTALRNQNADFINGEEFDLFEAAAQLRNRAVHEAPPVRHSIDVSSARGGQEMAIGEAGQEADTVTRFISLVFEIYRRLNSS